MLWLRTYDGNSEASSHIRKYIQDQERDDIMKDKLSVKEYEDPFGNKTVKKNNNNPAKK